MAEGRAALWQLHLGPDYPGFKVFAYVAGTTTEQTIWSDSDKTDAIVQPYVTGSDGWATFYGDGDYNLVIQDSDGVTIKTLDPIRITDDQATIWEGSHGTTLPAATSQNKWHLFSKHDANDQFNGLSISDGRAYRNISVGIEVFNVKDYGAIGNGTIDDTAAIQDAIDAAQAVNGALYIPPSVSSYRAIGLTITEPIAILGGGYATHIESNGDGSIFYIDEGATQNVEGQNPGITVRDLRLSGNSRKDNACAFKLAHLDHSRFDNLWIEEFLGTNEANNNGACFTFWDSVRECYFSNIKMRYGGTYNTKHMLFIADAGPDTQDSSNTCTFSECQFVYYYGDSVVVTDSAASSNRVRGMRFIDCLWHGVLSTLPIHAPTTNDETSRPIVITNSEANIVQNCLFSTTPRDNPCITINDDGTGAPVSSRVSCIVRGNRFTNHIGGSPGTKHAIKVEAGTCEIRGNTFVAQDPAWESLSGSTIYRDDSNIFIGAPTSGKITEATGSGPQVFSGDGIEQDLGGTYTVQTRNAAGDLIRRFSAAGNTDTKELKLQGVSLQVGSAVPTHTTDAGGAPLADVALYIRTPAPDDDSALYITTDHGVTWTPLLIGTWT